jgi:hypothetical protein
MNRSFNTKITAVVNDTVDSVLRAHAQKTDPIIKINPRTNTLTITENGNALDIRRKIVSRKPRHGFNMRVRQICKPHKHNTLPNQIVTLSDKDTAPIVSNTPAHFYEQLRQELETQITQKLNNYLEDFSSRLEERNTEYLRELESKYSQPLSPDYLKQISLAQEFLNENRSADLSRVKCLLRKMFPREYHDIIESLKEHQDPTIIYNISGGNNIIAPKAKTAKQLQENQDRTVNDER